MHHTAPRSDAFWLALAIAGLTALLLMLLLALVLCVPWRSNFMVFQLPQKIPAAAVPVIPFPEPTPSRHL